MSAFGDLKEMCRGAINRVVLIVRAHWNSKPKQAYPEVEDVDVTDRHEVVVYRANREYMSVYPPDRFIWDEPPINNFSVKNRFISFAASSLLAFSTMVIAIVGVVVGASIFGLDGLRWTLDIILEGSYFSNLGVDIFFAGLGLAAGLRLRQLDKDVTMRQCLDDAEEDLEDTEIMCHEVCLITMEQEIASNESDIAGHKRLIDDLSGKVEETWQIFNNIGSIPNLDRKKKDADHEALMDMIMAWRSRISDLRSKVDSLRSRSKHLQAEIHRIQASAPLIGLATDVLRLKTGLLDAQIEEMNKSADERLRQAEDKIRDLRKTLLFDADVLAIEEDKPKLLE